MFEFTLKIDSAVAELLGLDGDSIIEAFYDPDEDEIVIRVLDEDELDGEFNAPPPAMAVRCSARNTESALPKLFWSEDHLWLRFIAFSASAATLRFLMHFVYFWASAPMISSAFEPRVMRSSSAERRSATIAAPASIGQMRPPLLRHCAVSFPLCLPMFRRRPSSI